VFRSGSELPHPTGFHDWSSIFLEVLAGSNDVSLAYNLVSIFAGALSPLIATGLTADYKPET
jgi:hypothetical protein